VGFDLRALFVWCAAPGRSALRATAGWSQGVPHPSWPP